jgi:hypothetical protein
MRRASGGARAEIALSVGWPGATAAGQQVDAVVGFVYLGEATPR